MRDLLLKKKLLHILLMFSVCNLSRSIPVSQSYNANSSELLEEKLYGSWVVLEPKSEMTLTIGSKENISHQINKNDKRVDGSACTSGLIIDNFIIILSSESEKDWIRCVMIDVNEDLYAGLLCYETQSTSAPEDYFRFIWTRPDSDLSESKLNSIRQNIDNIPNKKSIMKQIFKV